MKKLLSEYPELIKEWHPSRNGDSSPEQFTCGNKKKAWWLCPKGHSYVATIDHRTRKIHRRIVSDRGGAGRIKRTFTSVSVGNTGGELVGLVTGDDGVGLRWRD